MTNEIEGFSVVECYHRRYWNGMVADLWHVDCEPVAAGHYRGRHPHLFVGLDAELAAADADFRFWHAGSDKPIHNCHRNSVFFIPAGMAVRSKLHGITHIRHLDIHFDADELMQRLGNQIDADSLSTPRFIMGDDRLISLAKLIAAECASPDPLHNRYGEGLVQSLILAVLDIKPSVQRRRSPLAGWQLRRAIDFIEKNCMRLVRLEEIASLTGLSESHFSHAFKASTGMAPQQWQMNARMERIKGQLVGSNMPLTTLAADNGFADAAHFSRTFRRHVGMTPSAWRRLHRQ